VDLKNFHKAKPFSRAKLGYKTDDVLLVYAGRLAPEKNLPFLLKSFAGIAETLPNVQLLLIGSGIQQFEEEIRNLVGELNLTQRVRFTGRIAYEELPAYLAMCNIFVTASISEVHPLSVIEAMGAGLPVMGIYSVGVSDTVQDGTTGLLATHDLPAFTAKLTRLCLDLNLRTQMGDAARKASSVYGIERTTNLMLNHYEKLIHEYKPRKGNWAVHLQRLLKELMDENKRNVSKDGNLKKRVSQ
jgi:glycosyltransferase involved in cell wall biosynthesis